MYKYKRERRIAPPIKYSTSLTIPGQSLLPAEMLKRHLAGTLPDIQHEPQFTHDEEGNQISEDLSHMELHELHDLARTLRSEYDKRAAELKDESELAYRQSIIDEYKKSHDENQKPAAAGTETAL